MRSASDSTIQSPSSPSRNPRTATPLTPPNLLRKSLLSRSSISAIDSSSNDDTGASPSLRHSSSYQSLRSSVTDAGSRRSSSPSMDLKIGDVASDETRESIVIQNEDVDDDSTSLIQSDVSKGKQRDISEANETVGILNEGIQYQSEDEDDFVDGLREGLGEEEEGFDDLQRAKIRTDPRDILREQLRRSESQKRSKELANAGKGMNSRKCQILAASQSSSLYR
jgi:hypothetical protein